ncbi:hypothetical protein ACQQ2N_14435 [Dokdonella sp. MW10]|uniref:hypothetical protein n=1 Tax=Dokdonella sp. MW10 TaxID=2992926 RepID=UPI003F8046CA
MGYEITSESITTESGALRVVADYQAIPGDAATIVRQSNLRHNGQPNCQGRPAEYVVQRFVIDIEMEVVDGRLRVYMLGKPRGKYEEFERVK